MASKRHFGTVPVICAWCRVACFNQLPVTLALLVTDEFQDPLEDEERHETSYATAIWQSPVSCESYQLCGRGVFLPSVKTDSFL
jgi:hypothetical protein